MDLSKFLGLAQFGYLLAPIDFWNLPDEKRESYGCGPGKLGDLLVPDTFYGLSIKQACEIHDYCYEIGETLDDKTFADILFLVNTLAIIEHRSGKLLKIPRTYRAITYYIAVRDAGKSAFLKA